MGIKLTKQEEKIYDDFMQELESNTYTRKEIVEKKMARAVSFFVTETALKEPLKRLIRDKEKH